MTTERELADLSDTLRPRVRALIDAAAGAGHRLGITSAWRSRAEQQRLYDGWKARKPGFNPANPPGMSQHENTGPNGEPAADACDLDYPDGRTARALAVAWVKANAHLFGLHLPIRREDWHLESDGRPFRPTPTQEDDMARLITEDGRTIYGTDGVRAWHVPSPPVLTAMKKTGVYGDGKIHTVPAGTVRSLLEAEK